MARSSKKDPVDKFRFRVVVLNLELGISSRNALSDVTGGETGSIRAGFSEVTLPRVAVTEIKYRENVDAPRHIKVPGLVNYEPVVLSRGVTSNRELYRWYNEVNNDANQLGFSNDLLAAQNFPPPLSADFRRDLRIDSLDRTGDTVKSWFLFNAFPIEYSPGDGLNSKSNEKLIESLTISYEAFLEVPDESLDSLTTESLKAARTAALSGTLSGLVTGFT